MKALLIIDMQNICFSPDTPRFDTKGVVDRINRLAHFFRSENQPVIFVQHDGTKQNICYPGTKDWEIISDLDKKESDIILPKTAHDAFYKTGLMKILQDNGVTEIVITGCATDYCVDFTVKSALFHDLDVTIISDGHTTADRPGIEAKEIIRYFNWLWADYYPTEGRILVCKSDELIAV
jgi:nicotinamidase-related amidase